VYNVRAVLEGRLPLSAGLASEFYDCLACRGCESVCPAGVPVGNIMEEARGLVTEAKIESSLLRWTKRFLLSGVVAHPRRLALFMTLARWGDALGLRRVVAAIAPALGERAALLPRVTKPSALAARYEPEGASRGRVALFAGCIASHLFDDVNEATARVLQRNGYEVVVPKEQVCCGALHLHNGLPDTGRELAAKNIDAFRDVDAIIVNAAGCGAALSEYAELVASNPGAASFSKRVVDIAEFLVREGFEPPTAPPAPLAQEPLRVAYDAPCHLFHAQGIKNEPRELLAKIPGVELVDYPDSERCCGSAGIYNVTHYDMAMEMLEEKMKDIVPARPDIIATGNPGCHMQLSEGVRRALLKAEVVHPVVLLDRAYQAER
jgi:glycolate oxidase iron-sulfur subunit